jgi:uncharacterized membrane protein YhaH (DUF805 family)
MELVRFFFSFSGRVNRAKYWIGVGIVWGMGLLAMKSWSALPIQWGVPGCSRVACHVQCGIACSGGKEAARLGYVRMVATRIWGCVGLALGTSRGVDIRRDCRVWRWDYLAWYRKRDGGKKPLRT